MKALIIGLLFFAIISDSCAQTKGFPVYGNLSKTTYSLHGSGGAGTGAEVSLPSGKKVILTNWHVCEVGDKFLMAKSEYYGSEVKAKILATDPLHDLCAVEAIQDREALSVGSHITAGVPVYSAGYPQHSMNKLVSGMGMTEAIVWVHLAFNYNKGCPKGFDPTFSPTMTCMRSFHLFDVSIPVEPGCSGSAVVNSRGELVGVINSTHGKTGAMILLDDVISFLNSL